MNDKSTLPLINRRQSTNENTKTDLELGKPKYMDVFSLLSVNSKYHSAAKNGTLTNYSN